MTAYLNGQFLPIEAAKISPLDRGFLFGDGAYEVIPVYSRCAFRIDEHLNRLQQTLDGIRLANPHPAAQWRTIVERVIADSAAEDQSVYIQVTRGADNKRDQAFPPDVTPTTFVFTAPLITPTSAQRETGIAVISALDNRWLRCDLKTVALLANVLLRQQAIDAGCVETIMLREGYLTEGAASNIFVVRNGLLLAPPKDHRMLAGITYDVVLELAGRHGMPYAVREISEAEVRTADELWMTSSTKEILPITTLDGKPVGNGKPGPAARQMYAWYCAFRDEVMRKSDA
jgi:D-alanine transaminase